MIVIYDSASMAQTLTLDLAPELRSLLERRFDALKTRYGDLSDATEWFVIQPFDRESDIVEQLGYSPLEEPIDGVRFGSESFTPFWDHLVRHSDGYYEMAISYGGTFATLILVEDAEGTLPDLLAMCREYAV